MRNRPNFPALRQGLSLAVLVFAMTASVRPVRAEDGTLDTSFNKNGTQPGVVVTDFNGSDTNEARGVAIDSQGRIVAAGYAESQFAVARYKPDGTLDTNSFGLLGMVTTDFSGAHLLVNYGTAVVLDGQGRIVVVGVTGVSVPRSHFTVVRYNSNGTLDTTFNPNSAFGPFPGAVITDFSNGTSTTEGEAAFAVAIDGQGRILVAGVSTLNGSQDFAVARYNTDGSLDTTFNPNSAFGPFPGVVLTDFSDVGHPNVFDSAKAIAIDSQGRIVVAGISYYSGSSDFALVRYNPTDGSRDMSFGFEGMVLTDFTPAGNTTPSQNTGAAVAIDKNDNIVVGGSTLVFCNCTAPPVTIFALARYLASDGQADPTFGTNGQVTLNINQLLDERDQVNAVTIDSAGRIVVAGSSAPTNMTATDFAVGRFLPDGTPDSSFGGNPVSTVDILGAGANDVANAVAIDGQGRIVLAGYAQDGAGLHFALARFEGVESDLSVTKTVDLTTAATGNTLTYTLTVNNAGPDAASGVSVTDALPSSVTFVSCGSTGGGVCAGTGNNRTVSFASPMASGASATVTLKATVNSGLADPTIITNTASVSSTTTDPSSANNTASATTTVHKSADVSLTKTVSPTSAAPGDPVTYTITVSNVGPDAAAGIDVTDTLPPSVTFVSCNSTGGGVCSGTGNESITFASPLASGASAVVTIKATLKPGLINGSTFSNTASVTEATADPNPANNTATAIVTVINKADISIANSVAKSNVRDISYTLTVTNAGPFAAEQLVINDPLPTGTVFSSIAPGAWSCSTPAVGAAGTVNCTLPELLNTPVSKANTSVTVVVKVTVPGSVTINDTATVGASTFDPNPANNSISFSTRLSAK